MISAESQIPMPLSPTDEQASEARWLGLATDHRRLFDALQDGWLRPMMPQAGILAGVGRYIAERNPNQEGHPIPVHIALDAAKLPELRVATFRSGRWESRSIREIESSDTALYWPGVLPAFAIREIVVSTEEERTRLAGMARFVSNLILPEEAIRIGPAPADISGPEGCPSDVTGQLAIPGNEDAVHGAMTMAVWAVPRIDPWLDLLATSLASDRSRLPILADNVDASWWRFPPWAPSSDHTKPLNPQERLWLAAVDTLSIRPIENRIALRELAERIADTASRYECSINLDEISDWLKSTHGILRAESVVRLDDWRACPVGKAIQLVLTRPDPIKFKSWFQDLPDLPPAVAWSAATLCGLLHGYGGWMPIFVERHSSASSCRFSHYVPAPTRHEKSTGRRSPPANLAGAETPATSYCPGAPKNSLGVRRRPGAGGMPRISKMRRQGVKRRWLQENWIGSA